MTLTIDEAIKIKLQWRKDNYPPALADEMNADMLSIEALYRCLGLKQYTDPSVYQPMPGETKE